MKEETTKYHCEMCKKKCDPGENSEFVKTISESYLWKRMHVRFIVRSGVNNNSQEEPADLCKACTRELLQYVSQCLKNGVDDNCMLMTKEKIKEKIREAAEPYESDDRMNDHLGNTD